MPIFTDRTDAGRRLAAKLARWSGRDVVVAGLPRGGMPVAFEVARALGAPLDVIVVRKLGMPWQPELAMGAVAEGGARFVNTDLVRERRIRPRVFEAVERHERIELGRRVLRWRRGTPPLALEGHTVIVVDDGIATGATAKAACLAARARGAGHIVFAAPVGAPGSVRAIGEVADEVVCVSTPERLSSVGWCYADFTPVTDEDVENLLHAPASG